MLNLSRKTDGAVEITDDTFIEEVLVASQEKPVLVDFQAVWCQPCKVLGPVLEEVVAETGGKVKLCKIDVDQNQMFAAKLKVQSIPAVFAFLDGQPVDGFMGNLPAARVREFVTRLVERGDPHLRSIEDLIGEADERLEAGEPIAAAELYAQVLQQEDDNLRAFAGLITANMKAGELDTARQMIASIPADKRGDAHIAAAINKIEIAEETTRALGEAAKYLEAVEADPDDHASRFELSKALIAQGENDAAVDHLLEIFRRDREWNDGAAKAQLFKLFDSFGPTDPATLRGRRRLTSMIYT